MDFKERPYKLYQCFFFNETGLPTAGRIGSWLSQLLMAPGNFYLERDTV